MPDYAIPAKQRIERIMADLKKMVDRKKLEEDEEDEKGEELRDVEFVFAAFQDCLAGLSTLDDAVGMTPGVRKELARDIIAFAALQLTPGMPNCGNGLFGSTRATACQKMIENYVNFGNWDVDQHRKTRPAGADGECWTLLKYNGGVVPSTTYLRKLHTKIAEQAVAQISGSVPDTTPEARLSSTQSKGFSDDKIISTFHRSAKTKSSIGRSNQRIARA